MLSTPNGAARRFRMCRQAVAALQRQRLGTRPALLRGCPNCAQLHVKNPPSRERAPKWSPWEPTPPHRVLGPSPERRARFGSAHSWFVKRAKIAAALSTAPCCPLPACLRRRKPSQAAVVENPQPSHSRHAANHDHRRRSCCAHQCRGAQRPRCLQIPRAASQHRKSPTGPAVLAGCRVVVRGALGRRIARGSAKGGCT